MNELKREVALDEPQYYPLKDWSDRDVTEPEDLNSEILVWEISPSLEGEKTFIRSRQEALDYLRQVVELNFGPNPDGTMPPLEDYQVTMQLVLVPLGEYIEQEGN